MSEAVLLTDACVRSFKPQPPHRRRIRDTGAKSLFLIISPSGHKAWMLRLRGPDGKQGKMVLGPLDLSGREIAGVPITGQPLTLSAARQLAATLLRDKAMGTDVVAEHKLRKQRQRRVAETVAAASFATAARDYIAEYARPNARGWRETARVLGLAYDPDGAPPEFVPGGLAERWHDRPAAAIDRAAISTLVDECRRRGIPGLAVGTEGLSEARARKMLSRLSGMFSWLLRRDRVVANPCVGIDCGAAGKRDRYLSDDELRLLWRACADLGPHGAVVKLLILTGARLREVAGMRRDELRDSGATWELPASRSKNKRAHTVPLPPLARTVIEAGAGPFDTLFSVTGGRTAPEGWSWAKAKIDAAMLALSRAERGADATIEPWRLHDIRRTVVTGMSELGIRPDVVELTINHASGARAGVAGTYNKSELLPERRAALERWNARIERMISGDRDGVVVRMPQR